VLGRLSRRRSRDPSEDVAGGIAADEEGADAFVSYSRKDQATVLRIASALGDAGWNVWVDREDVPPASEWREELASGIRAAHTFVFVISQRSVESDYCRWELAEAVRLGKRLIPVVIEDVREAPPQLAARQYVFMRPEDDFDDELNKLITALATDLEWVREHRHWLLEALRWDAHGRERSLLVRGDDLKRAEAWFARQKPDLEPRPTELQAQYLLAGRAWETRRTQIIAVAVGVALVVTAVLGVVAWLQRNEARNQAATARSRELAIAADSQRAVDPQRALLLAIEAVNTKATAEADNALRQATFAHRLVAEIPTRAKRIGALIDAVTFSPDGTNVAAALKDGSVPVAVVARSGPGRVVVLPAPEPSVDNPCATFAGTAQVHVAFSSDGSRIAATNLAGWTSVWRWPRPGQPDVSDFCLGRSEPPTATELFAALGGPSRPPPALGFRSNELVQLVETDGDLVSWRWGQDGRPRVRRLSAPPVVAAAFSADGAVVAVASERDVQVFVRGREHAKAVDGVYALTLDGGGRLVAAVTGRSIAIWRVGDRRPAAVLRAPAVVRSVALDSGGEVLAAGDVRNTIHVWELASDEQPIRLAGAGGPVTALAFSPDGKRIASGSDDGVLRVWAWDPSRPTAAAREAHQFARVPAGAELAVSRDRRRAAAPVERIGSRSVLLWDAASGPQPMQLTFPRGVNGVALSPDGETLAVAESRTFRVVPWLQTEGRVLAASADLQYTAPVFSADGRRVAVAGFTGKNSIVLAWEVDERAPVARFGVTGFVHELALSEDGERLAAGSTDGGVRIFDLASDASPIVLRGHEGAANAVAFSPDGRELASGGADGTVRVWELATGKPVVIPGPGGSVQDVWFSANGSDVVATSTRRTRSWSCGFCGQIEDVLERAERLTTRELTPAERAVFLHER
jgi:WD40 repeat protein